MLSPARCMDKTVSSDEYPHMHAAFSRAVEKHQISGTDGCGHRSSGQIHVLSGSWGGHPGCPVGIDHQSRAIKSR